MKNQTANDAAQRIADARKDCVKDASMEYLDALVQQLNAWLEDVRDVAQVKRVNVELFDLSDVEVPDTSTGAN